MRTAPPLILPPCGERVTAAGVIARTTTPTSAIDPRKLGQQDGYRTFIAMVHG